MDKIASPQELAHELRRLLAYAGSHNPSRVKLASGLKKLARQMVVDEEAWMLASGAREALSALEELSEGADDLAQIYRETPWKGRRLDLVRRDTRDALRTVGEIVDELEALGGK